MKKILSRIQEIANELCEGTHDKSEYINGYDVYFTLFIQEIESPFAGSYDFAPHSGRYQVTLEKIECDDEEMTEQLQQYVGKL